MKAKTGLLSRRKLFAAVFLLMQTLVFVLPCQAEVTWHDFSRSLNSAFSGGQLFETKNVLGFFLTALFIMMVVLVFRRSSKKEKEIFRKPPGWTPVRPQGLGQKRYWFRMGTSAEFEWIFAGEALRAGKDKYNKDRLVDISGGGICFATTAKLNPGDEIKFFIDIGRDRPMPLNGKVVRVEEGDESGMHKVAVQFINILSGERDRIVSWIMRGQRAAIHKKRQDDGVIPSETI